MVRDRGIPVMKRKTEYEETYMYFVDISMSKVAWSISLSSGQTIVEE